MPLPRQAAEARIKAASAAKTPRKKTAEEKRIEHEVQTAREYAAEMDRFRLAQQKSLDNAATGETTVGTTARGVLGNCKDFLS
jgi:hypothetical protein